jgi:hypothetical protein
MDPLALAAVVGLVFAGQRFSASEPVTTVPIISTPHQLTRQDVDLAADAPGRSADAFGLRPINPSFGRRIGDTYLPPKEAIPSLQDWSPIANRYPHGQPVYDLYNRENVTNKMNNLQPMERIRVGPGLGVGPNVPAIGGFHQFFRALPNNVNEEKLVTLPGGEGPASYFVKGGGMAFPGQGLINGTMSHQAKVTKAWTRPPAQNSGQGQGIIRAPEGRPDQIKTRRTTIRQETGWRKGDGLEMGPGQYATVYQAYTGQLTDTGLPHSTGNRVNPDRAGNGQRMNVTANPQGAIGAATRARSESIPLRPGPMDLHATGGAGPYKAPENWELNNAKCVPNPMASSANLNIARNQINRNPLAVPAWATV